MSITAKEYFYSTSRVIGYAYAYVLLEWLFFVTKPSFLSAWPASEKISALLVGALPFLIGALALHALFCLAAWILACVRGGLADIGRVLLKATPALIVVAIALILADNFTYTVFGWGIADTGVYTAPLYWLFGLLVFVLHIRHRPTQFRLKATVCTILLAASGGALAWSFYSAGSFLDGNYHSDWTGPRLPNIIMFASDGVTADHMSAYGYQRETTPNLDRYLDEALIADNAFTNSGWTTGSLSSMMTGKYPATTKLLYPPYTLKGIDAYQNLPRILHKLGYINLQETVRYYADGADLNWQDSFDFANGRTVHWPPVNQALFALQSPLMLSNRLYERLSDRIQQLLFIKQMVNSYAAVTSERDIAKVQGIPDEKRMARVFDFIRKVRQPFFIHIHLLGTHCCDFHLASGDKRFSARKSSTKDMAKSAAFDDTILRSDRYFGQLMALLKKRHLLGNTLIVYTSDHDKGWDFRSPVPLIFLFPNGAHQGHIAATTQLLDVAPTILDYLKVKVPDWMEGRSLLNGKLNPDRSVFVIFRLERTHFRTDKGDRISKVVDTGPPTYGLRWVGMVVCHRWYVMRITDGKMKSGPVGTFENKYSAAPGAPIAPTPCTESGLPTTGKARAMMSQYLKQRGFSF